VHLRTRLCDAERRRITISELSSDEESLEIEKADARIRTADPFITSDDGDIGKALQIALYRVREQP